MHDRVAPLTILLCSLLSLTVFTSCERPAPPVLGVATASVYLGAARMALDDDAEREGGLPVDTVLIDEGTNRAAPAIRSAERLVGTDGLIAVVGHSNSAASLAASQIYNEREIVQIAPQSSATIYSRAGPFSFRLVPPDDHQGTFIVEQIRERLPEGGSVGVLYVNDDYGRGLRTALLDALEPERFDVVLQIPHIENAERRDNITHTVVELERSRPDLIVWLGRGGVLHHYLPPIREVLGSVPIIGSDATGTGRRNSNVDGRWDGVMFVDFLDLDSTPKLRAFSRRYRDRFGRSPTGADALTYDAVQLVLVGVRDGVRGAQELRRFLDSLGRDREPVEGITGDISFDPSGDVERSYVALPVHPGDDG